MRDLILIASVFILSILGNSYQFYKYSELEKENKKLQSTITYQKAQNDLNEYFKDLKQKNSKEDSNNLTEETKKETVSVSHVIKKESESKKAVIYFGIFSTEYFLNENVSKLKKEKIDFSLKEHKKGTVIFIGPLPEKEAKNILQNKIMPKDAKLIYVK